MSTLGIWSVGIIGLAFFWAIASAFNAGIVVGLLRDSDIENPQPWLMAFAFTAVILGPLFYFDAVESRVRPILEARFSKAMKSANQGEREL